MKKLLIALCALSVFGCSHVNTIDTKMEEKGSINTGEKIGIQEGKAIVQLTTPVEDELMRQRWKNADLEQQLRNDHYQLEWCQRDIADPRLGGNGEASDVPEVAAAMDLSKVKETMGLTEDGTLALVKKELVEDRLARERAYQKALEASAAVVGKHLKKCEQKMSVARVKAGLPQNRYYRTDKYEYETNLDAAFRNASKAH